MPRWQSQSDGFSGSGWSKSQRSLSDGRKSQSSSGWKSSGSLSTPSLTTLGHIRSSPKYSIPGGGRPQSSPGSAEGPGPGDYDLIPPLGNEDRAPSFGSSARAGLGVFNKGPGPAAYSLEGSLSKKGMRMGPTKSDPSKETAAAPSKEKVDTMPGPGAYGEVIQNRQRPRAKALVKNGFGSAVRKSFADAVDKDASPGPAYLPGQWPRGKPSQNSSFGASERRSPQHSTAAPGPGTYDVKSSLKGPKWTTTTRGEEQLETGGLGPGSYTMHSTLNQRKFTISGTGHKSLAQKAEGPAPGDYNLAANSNSKWKSRSTKFGSSTRGPPEDIIQFEYPGPGWYRPKYPDARVPEAGLGKTARAVGLGSKETGVGSARPWYLDGPCSGLDIPGPMSYETSTGLEGPKISISEKLNDASIRGFEKRDKVPGPGAYDQKQTETEAHQTVMGNLVRSVNIDKGEGPARPWYLEASYRHPGPGAYRPERYEKGNVGSEGPTGPRFGASMKARTKQTQSFDDTPGPGAHGPVATCIGC